MSPRVLVLSGLGGSRAEWEGTKRALGWPTEIGSSLPAAGSVVVIGHSSGGVGALKIAVAHPDRVDAVVLTSGFFPPVRGGRTTAATIADYVSHRASFVRVARKKRAPRPTRRGGRELASLARLGIRRDRFHAVAANARCPVLVIHGDADHVVPVAFARAALSRHPTWTYHEIHDAGHHPHRDRPKAWAKIVTAWLQRPTS